MDVKENIQLRLEYQAAMKELNTVSEIQQRLYSETEEAEEQLKELTEFFPRLLANYHLKREGFCETVVLNARCKISWLKIIIAENPKAISELGFEKQRAESDISRLRDILTTQKAPAAKETNHE